MIDLRKEFADQPWIAACFCDDDRAGLVLGSNVIVLGLGAGLKYAEAKAMADEHNAALGAGERT